MWRSSRWPGKWPRQADRYREGFRRAGSGTSPVEDCPTSLGSGAENGHGTHRRVSMGSVPGHQIQVYSAENMSKNLSCLMLAFLLASCSSGRDWRTADRNPAGIAPDPSITGEAVLQAYAAPAWGWRGWFAVHTW